MYYYSQKSKEKLYTCHDDLKLIFNEAIKEVDITITDGHRSPEYQFSLYTRGRRLENGVWIIDNEDEIITYKDGFINKSAHNNYPSMATDAVVWFKDKPHIRYDDEDSFFDLWNILNSCAIFLLNKKEISHKLLWGGNWKMLDLPHFQLTQI